MGRRVALFALMFMVVVVVACSGGAKQPAGTTTTAPTTKAKPKPAPEPPSAPKPQLVDVTTLTVWEGNVDGGPVVVTAADADGEILRRVLVPSAIEIIAVHTDTLVTGRVAGSRVGVVSALASVEPKLKLGPRAKLGGKGPGAEMNAIGVESGAVFRMLADSAKTNVVVLAPPAKLTVSAKAPSAQKLLEHVAKVAGLVADKAAANVVVVRASSQPKVGKLPAKGAKIDLDVRQARAGDVLALIAAATGAATPATACTAGDTIDLRLTGVPGAAASKLVEHLGGDKVTACAVASLPGNKKMELALVAMARAGSKKVGLAMSGTQALLIPNLDETTMPAWKVDDAAAASAASEPPAPDALPTARLAATITGIPSGDVAIVEIDGRFAALTKITGDEPGVVSVGMGEVEVRDAAGATHVLRLARRPP